MDFRRKVDEIEKHKLEEIEKDQHEILKVLQDEIIDDTKKNRLRPYYSMFHRYTNNIANLSRFEKSNLEEIMCNSAGNLMQRWIDNNNYKNITAKTEVGDLVYGCRMTYVINTE